MTPNNDNWDKHPTRWHEDEEYELDRTFQLFTWFGGIAFTLIVVGIVATIVLFIID